MSTSATVSVSVSFPPDAGQPTAPHTYTSTLSFDQKDDDIYVLTQAGTTSITLKGPAKLLFIKIGATTPASEVEITVNAGTDSTPVPTGGCLLICSPTPDTGISTIGVTVTAGVTITLIGLA